MRQLPCRKHRETDSTAKEDHMDSTEPTTAANLTGIPDPQPGPGRPTARELLEELKLGVDGQGTQADSERLAKAKEVLKDFEEKSDRAYAAASWPDEPSLIEPFGASLLVQHDGNLSAVLTDPAFRDTVTTALGLDPYEQRIPDEDGGRDERIYPAETEEGLKEIAGTIAGLEDSLAAETTTIAGTPGTEPVLNWARQHEPGLDNAYHETFRHVGEEEARAQTLTKLTEGAHQHSQ